MVGSLDRTLKTQGAGELEKLCTEYQRPHANRGNDSRRVQEAKGAAYLVNLSDASAD